MYALVILVLWHDPVVAEIPWFTASASHYQFSLRECEILKIDAALQQSGLTVLGYCIPQTNPQRPVLHTEHLSRAIDEERGKIGHQVIRGRGLG